LNFKVEGSVVQAIFAAGQLAAAGVAGAESGYGKKKRKRLLYPRNS
jgi:hypothetical protein